MPERCRGHVAPRALANRALATRALSAWALAPLALLLVVLLAATGAVAAQDVAPDAGCAAPAARKTPKASLLKHFAVRAVAAQPSGRVVLTGSMALAPFQGAVTATTMALEADGTIAWSAQFDHALHGNSSGLAVTLDAAGNTYVSTDLSVDHQFVLAKYAPDGSETWVAHIDDHVVGDDVFHRPDQLHVDATGSVRMLATLGRFLSLTRLEPDGSEQWAIGLDPGEESVEPHRGIGVDTAGDSYFAHFQDRALVVRKVSAGGSAPWAQTIHPPDIDLFTGGDLVANGAGDSWCACPYEARDGFDVLPGVLLVKHSASGSALWTRRIEQLSLPTPPTPEVGALPGVLAVDADDAVYLFGTRDNEPATPLAAQLLKYAADGTLEWTRHVPSAALRSTVAGALSLDLAGNPVLATRALSPALPRRVLSLDPAGRLRWDVPLTAVLGKSYDWAPRALTPLAAGGMLLSGPSIFGGKPRPVSGTVAEPSGVAGGTLAIKQTALAFGSTTLGAPPRLKVLKLRNTSSTECLTVSLAPAAPFYAEGPFILPPRGKLKLKLAFAPQAAGTHEQLLILHTSDPTQREIDITLSGEALAPAR